MAQANGVGRIGVMASVGLPGLAILGSVFYVAFQGQANTASIDRINDRLNKIEASERETVVLTTKQAEALTEIETQFCADDIVRNLMHANEMRTASLLWQKSFPGTTLPTDNAYYPTICNRRTAQ